jgi:uncharacterized protein (TIGR00730 family)
MTEPASRVRITVYCGSARGRDDAFLQSAETFGRALGERGFDLVYGGGGIGLMGTLAKSAQRAGARVTGIITEQFLTLEQGWRGCDELIVVPSMRERKQQMEERAQAFAILPGGLGTYEEFFEALVGRVIGRHDKPIGLLNVRGAFDPLVALLDHGVEVGFVREAARALVHEAQDPLALLDTLARNRSDAGVAPHDPTRMLPMHGPHG